ncbi:histidine phosphatase family protein [Paracoccus albus]|uniref:histidine phosphatase family protein n=1 Tax=Paracoccus albus TaxID=3017784 RepID=UPI0022F121C2|nr:histidine phosphatase family protein [Paracoccus albus]WBU62056.1 histidine phosphatase family protein [Paracoccus albus]
MVTLRSGAFLFLRHGQTAANAQDIICGSTDLPLNESGIAQARQAAAFLKHTGVQQIVVSPLKRAQQTAQPVAKALGLRIQISEGLAERNWGVWEGQPRSILRREETPPKGEALQAFNERTEAAFSAIDLDLPTLIVAHSGTDRAIHRLLADGPHIRMANAAIRLWEPAMQGTQWNCHECFKPER